MKLPVKMVDWVGNMSLHHGKFDKRLAARDVGGLWYIGTGILVETKGEDDIFVPIGSVHRVLADGNFTPSQWAGDEPFTPPAPVVAPVVTAKAKTLGAPVKRRGRKPHGSK